MLSVVLSNNVVYSVSNYTIQYNFTSYDLQNGYLWTVLPNIINIVGAGVNASGVVCQINGQAMCTVIINSTGTYINTTVISTTKIYTIIINNIRNPPSTQPFTISSKVAYITG